MASCCRRVFPASGTTGWGPPRAAAATADRLRLDHVERLQLSLRREEGVNVSPGSYGVEVESIVLRLTVACARAGPYYSCMATPTRLIVRGLAAFALAAAVSPLRGQSAVASPNGRNKVTITVNEGRLYYSLERDRRQLILPSLLGFEFRGAVPLRDGLRVTDTVRQSHDEWWTQPWGEVARVRDHYNELAVGVVETAPPNRRFTVRVRAFNDGVGFRYEVPAQPGLAAFEISNELTEFALADNARAWWIPSNRPRKDRSEDALLVGTGEHARQRADAADDGDARRPDLLVIHEANLVHYARMFLAGPPDGEPHAARGARPAAPTAIKVRGTHAVRHAVANDPARRPRRRTSRRRCSA